MDAAHSPPSGRLYGEVFFDCNRFEWYDLDKLTVTNLEYPENINPKIVRPWEPQHFKKIRQLPLL